MLMLSLYRSCGSFPVIDCTTFYESLIFLSHVPRIFHLPFKLRNVRRTQRSRIAAMLIPPSAICIFIAPFYAIYKPPAFLIRYFQHRWPDVLWRASTPSKIAALTIDDGPSGYIGEIMQTSKPTTQRPPFPLSDHKLQDMSIHYKT